MKSNCGYECTYRDWWEKHCIRYDASIERDDSNGNKDCLRCKECMDDEAAMLEALGQADTRAGASNTKTT